MLQFQKIPHLAETDYGLPRKYKTYLAYPVNIRHTCLKKLQRTRALLHLVEIVKFTFTPMGARCGLWENNCACPNPLEPIEPCIVDCNVPDMSNPRSPH